jgi:hypothetical protein
MAEPAVTDQARFHHRRPLTRRLRPADLADLAAYATRPPEGEWTTMLWLVGTPTSWIVGVRGRRL